MRVKPIATFLGFMACSFITASAHALVVATPSPQIPCPVYAACEPGMEGYVTGVDKNGCEIMSCRPIGTGENRPDYEPPEDKEPPPRPHDPGKEYKYEGDSTDKSAIPPRMIDVQ